MSDIDKRESIAPPPPGYGAGIFFLAWAAVGWYGVLFSPTLMASFTAPGLDPGAAILPMMVSTALTAGGAWLVLRGLMTRNSGMKRIQLHIVAIPVLFLLSALLAAALIGFVGFMGPSFVFAFVWLAALNNQQRIWWKRTGLALMLAAGFTALIQIVFVHLLRVPLP
ncbi:Tripartite tricarboxylate transporter TctB family protein [Pseudorhodobacter antarcticus]|uniref:Tripartite tricarboxylate transporter TctB family protein n=1 Tax=Pseudorhodobacter antarcticus TaxID=1077947 RepID=A0A1H8L8U7_9RHOB|nr:tripartite tricarboxylate transporter TctB family protein [Pseudorhodobacter antarcticus]SEO01148.1 Tripartite tricarboxylate transporter TctB family protein [Pseudorhodobacter antarcticus]